MDRIRGDELNSVLLLVEMPEACGELDPTDGTDTGLAMDKARRCAGTLMGADAVVTVGDDESGPFRGLFGAASLEYVVTFFFRAIHTNGTAYPVYFCDMDRWREFGLTIHRESRLNCNMPNNNNNKNKQHTRRSAREKSQEHCHRRCCRHFPMATLA